MFKCNPGWIIPEVWINDIEGITFVAGTPPEVDAEHSCDGKV
jgi:hypothetical protein